MGTSNPRTAITLLPLILTTALFAKPPGGKPAGAAHPGAASWHLKGDGVVCCPCRVPCPCRMNAKPSFAHCEATLFLRIKQGQYGDVNLDGINLVSSGGMCAIDYQLVQAVYFSSSDSPERQAAFIALKSSFSSTPPGDPHAKVVSLNAQVIDEHLFKVSIPGIVEIVADRNWGLSSPPMPMVAAPDHFANQLQYIQNIRYSVHDPEAGLDFDYSRRQANYRVVDLTDEQYRTKSMLIQYADYSGWYSPGQMALIKAQHLQIPDPVALREQAIRLKGARGSP
ncbi:MAG: DUF1326 domain-containing protein [Terriglobia bacterium]